MMTLNYLTHYGWLKLMPRRMLQNTRDDIDQQWSEASEQLKQFQSSLQPIDGKLHTVPSPEGERVALAAVRRAWDSAVPFMERDEVQGWTRVVTELCRFLPFSGYSVRSLIGELEAETAAQLSQLNESSRALPLAKTQPAPPTDEPQLDAESEAEPEPTKETPLPAQPEPAAERAEPQQATATAKQPWSDQQVLDYLKDDDKALGVSTETASDIFGYGTTNIRKLIRNSKLTTRGEGNSKRVTRESILKRRGLSLPTD